MGPSVLIPSYSGGIELRSALRICQISLGDVFNRIPLTDGAVSGGWVVICCGSRCRKGRCETGKNDDERQFFQRTVVM